MSLEDRALVNDDTEVAILFRPDVNQTLTLENEMKKGVMYLQVRRVT